MGRRSLVQTNMGQASCNIFHTVECGGTQVEGICELTSNPSAEREDGRRKSLFVKA